MKVEPSHNVFETYRDLEQHLLSDPRPSEYLNSIYGMPIFCQYPFEMLHQLKETEQSPQHHPEGNVWNHTLLVVDEAAMVKIKSKDPRVLMWAALLHDIGKPSTTKNRKGKITSYNHEKIGAELAKEFLAYFTDDKTFINEVCGLIRYHMQLLFVVNELPFADIKGMKSETDIYEVALLGLSDRLGRGNQDRETEEMNIKRFLQRCE